MLTKAKLEEELKQAMLARDDVRKRTLRMVLTAVKLAEVEKLDELDEPELVAVLQKEVKTRKETIEEAERADRDDLLASTQAEIEVLEVYLPKPFTRAELGSLVRECIAESGAASPSDMGKVMKIIMPRIQGRADGKAVSELVRSFLNET
jgi:uncharacterized protein YqeY